MEAAVKAYASKEYPNSKVDMFAMFMETGFAKRNGFIAMINMHSWMFLSSFEKVRISTLASKTIISMLHLGARAFEAIGGEVVQTTTFVLQNSNISGYTGIYHRLVSADSQQKKESLFLSSKAVFNIDQAAYQSKFLDPLGKAFSDALKEQGKEPVYKGRMD